MFPEEPFGNDADASDYASENPGLKFITCHELHDAIARAFNTWSNNNKMIKFTDVTEQCKDDPDVNEGRIIAWSTFDDNDPSTCLAARSLAASMKKFIPMAKKNESRGAKRGGRQSAARGRSRRTCREM